MDSNISNEDQTPLTNNVLSQDPLAAGTPGVEEEPRHSQKSKGKGKAQVWSPWTTHRVEVLRFKPGFETFFVVENAERLDWAAGGQIQQSVWEYLNSCGDGEKTKVFTSDWPWESASLYQKNAGYELVKGNESKNEDQVNHCFQNMELTSTISLHECLRQIISVVDIKYSGLYNGYVGLRITYQGDPALPQKYGAAGGTSPSLPQARVVLVVT
ncbi:hypothetical protein BDN72DRAFT_965116 [Pluteus cervinus]|uniref:Uncharacterized protein n=1 Tax=Pluteus cervinus TaxID=181527 RepID=A0ACD3A9K3_9AGAR|nr:hypothetical protein BDN72DRAFT_965116 [Pluteus cervinus]